MRTPARWWPLAALVAIPWGSSAVAAPPASRTPASTVPTDVAAPPEPVLPAVAPAPAASPRPRTAPVQATATATTQDWSSDVESRPLSAELPLPPAPPSEPAVEVVPRQFGLAVGWAHLPIDGLPDALVEPRSLPHGVAAAAHALWQIAGLHRRWPVWIGPELSLDTFPATAVSRRVIALGGGLLIKHQLGRHRRWRPYLAYGLGAAGAWVQTLDGGESGLRSRVGLGAAVVLGDTTSLTLEFVYKHQALKTLRWDDAGTLDYSFHTLSLLLGVVFDTAPRRSRKARKRRRAAPP
ncbi:MAG: hypothetical protein KC486_17030 [Myxococcales bacterium]|nr:hypothetical protein [Myxococcales bacterium]